MPVIDAAIIAACLTQINTDFGPIPPGLTPTQQAAITATRENLAMVVARSGQYCRDNNEVNPGQNVAPGSFTNGGGPVSGTGETSSPGTWS